MYMYFHLYHLNQLVVILYHPISMLYLKSLQDQQINLYDYYDSIHVQKNYILQITLKKTTDFEELTFLYNIYNNNNKLKDLQGKYPIFHCYQHSTGYLDATFPLQLQQSHLRSLKKRIDHYSHYNLLKTWNSAFHDKSLLL